jgi:hypothetical protein
MISVQFFLFPDITVNLIEIGHFEYCKSQAPAAIYKPPEKDKAAKKKCRANPYRSHQMILNALFPSPFFSNG